MTALVAGKTTVADVWMEVAVLVGHRLRGVYNARKLDAHPQRVFSVALAELVGTLRL
jgi:hypothetical protein